MDDALARFENGARFLEQRGSASFALEYGQQRIGAQIHFAHDTARVTLKSRDHNHVERVWRSLESLSEGLEPLRFHMRRPPADDPMVSTSLLKSGFIVLFALFGYRYAFAPALDVVRRQIQDPKGQHIAGFVYTSTRGEPDSSREVFLVHHDDMPLGIGVGMGRRMALLPLPGDRRDLYEAANRVYSGGRTVSTRVTGLPWPNEPSFQLSDWFDGATAA